MKDIPDKELEHIREIMYKQGQLALEYYLEQKDGSKNPLRVYGLENDDMQN